MCITKSDGDEMPTDSCNLSGKFMYRAHRNYAAAAHW